MTFYFTYTRKMTFYFTYTLANPESRYFGVSDIKRDQVADYAKRKDMSVSEVERWLAPNLSYDPE